MNCFNIKAVTPIYDLHQAVESRDLNKCESLIKSGANINALRENFAPLHTAAGLGDLSLCTFLLAQGALVDVASSFGTTPLHRAAFYGHRDVCQLFLAKGADINRQTHTGETPLCKAVDQNYYDICRLLLDNKADVNIQERNQGNTPLHIACYEGRSILADLLIERGANLAILNKNGYTPQGLGKFRGNPCNPTCANEKVKSYNKEFLLRKLLGHAFGLPGSIKMTTLGYQINVPLVGGYAEYFWQKFGKTIANYGENFPCSFDFEKIGRACRQASASAWMKLDMWEKHQPVVLKTGYARHYFSVLIWNDNLAILNGGGGVMPGRYKFLKALATYKFKGQLTKEIIEFIEGQRARSSSESKDFFHNQLPKLLNYGPHDEFFLESMGLLIHLSKNCAWANSEKMILVMMILAKCIEKNIDVTTDRPELRQVIASERRVFGNWLSFQKLQLVKRYLKYCSKEEKSCPSDRNLLQKTISLGWEQSRSITEPLIQQQWDAIRRLV